MSRAIALVTDSTASLPADVVVDRDISVVPLQVVIGATSHDEGLDEDATPATIAAALSEWRPVSTSRPTPAVFLETYERLAKAGASEVLSIHLSGEVSGTYESAQLAAREASIPVRIVDTKQLDMGTGFAVLAAADVLDKGGSVEEAAGAALARADSTTSLFYVDTLEYLRRGGRIGAAAALLGSALAVKPLLHVEEGRIGTLEKVRTSARALSRLEELAVEAAADLQIDIAVAHLANSAKAELLAGNLRRRLSANLGDREVFVHEVGAVIGAHVGPGMVAVCIAPR